MRKALITAAVLLAALTLAASSTNSAGFSFGGTMKDDSFIFGLSGSTIQTADYSRNFGMGLGAHMDINFRVNQDDTNGFFAALIGPSFEIRPFEDLSVDIALGPAMVAEGGSFGIGAGLDVFIAYFFNDSFGIAGGGTIYPQFYVDDNDRDADFSFAGHISLGVAWRRKSYSWEENITYGPEKR